MASSRRYLLWYPSHARAPSTRELLRVGSVPSVSSSGRLLVDGVDMALFAELRLKQQLARLEGNDEEGRNNQLLIQALSPLERDLLRESLQVVTEFKKRLTRRFHLEY